MKNYPSIALVAVLASFHAHAEGAENSASENESAQASKTVVQYHRALEAGDAGAFRSTLSDQIVMYNCSADAGPAEWEPHLFLSGDDVGEWSASFVTEAGPHEGAVDIVSAKTNNGLALVVSVSTGRNKFRSWESESTAWLLGRIGSAWKIAGFCILDVQNSDQDGDGGP